MMVICSFLCELKWVNMLDLFIFVMLVSVLIDSFFRFMCEVSVSVVLRMIVWVCWFFWSEWVMCIGFGCGVVMEGLLVLGRVDMVLLFGLNLECK